MNRTTPLDWMLRFSMACVCLTCVPQAYAEVEPIFTKDNTFYVPYNVGPAVNEAQPSKVELHVSGDRGASWQLYNSQIPTATNRFAFRAGVDGEFWFAVKTVANDGTPDKNQITTPELIVIVDQEPPTIQISPTNSEASMRSLKWTVGDRGLEATPVIECRDGQDGAWNRISLLNATPNEYGDEISGTASINLPITQATIEVRASIADKAGNQTVITRSYPSDPVAFSNATGMQIASALGDSTAGMIPNNDIPWPIGTSAENLSYPSTDNIGPGATGTANATTRPEMGYPDTAGWRPSGETGSKFLQSNGPVGDMLPSGQPMQNPYSGGANGPSQPDSGSNTALARNERVSRSRRFQLEYEIEGAGAVGIHRVEVWATDNSGQTWRHLGDDEDKQSPYLVEVPQDGVIGFRLLIQAQEGIPVRPPMSGDVPDVWVRVDSTTPTTRITGARYGRGPNLGQLEISWTASDGDLIDSPITLFFGPTSNGPWRIAAEKLPNTGNYSWTVDDRVPSELYLRLEVQDRAGNIGHDTLRDPIRSEGLLPKGRIRDVQPASTKQPEVAQDSMIQRL